MVRKDRLQPGQQPPVDRRGYAPQGAPQGYPPAPYGYGPQGGEFQYAYPPQQPYPYSGREPKRFVGLRKIGTATVITGIVAGGVVGAAWGVNKVWNSENLGQNDPNGGTDTGKPLTPAEQQQIRESFPSTTVEAATAMGVDPKYVFKEGDKYTAEFFQFNDGIRYDADKGYHVNAAGDQVTDPQQIFDFDSTPIWQTVKNDSNGVLFARTGGAGGDQANISRFIGTGGSASMIEQASLLPPTEACIGDTYTDSWRQAVSEYVTNDDTWKSTPANQRVSTEWYNPITQELEKVDGKMIAALAQAGEINKSVIERLPAGYPLTPEQTVAMTGGTTRPENWSFNTQNGIWTYEGFNLAAGVRYDASTGLLYKNNQIITNAPEVAYNYAAWQSAEALWPTSFTMPEVPGTYTFLRTGGGSDINPNYSWYGFGKTVTGGQFEQAAIIPVPPQEGCTSFDVVDARMTADAQNQAQNPEVKQVIITTPAEYQELK